MSRHVPVERHSGVYYSLRAGGQRSYEVRYTDSTGRSRFKVCGPRLQDALDFQADIRVRLRRGERIDPKKITFSEVVAEWKEYRRGNHGKPLSANTIAGYDNITDNYLLKAFGQRRIQSISVDEVAIFLRDLRSHYHGGELKSGTKERIYSTLNDIFGYASNPRRGYLLTNPCMHLEQGERPRQEKLVMRVASADEIDNILRAAEGKWIHPIIQTALLTGMRASELLGLRWQDVDFERNEINVRGQLSNLRSHEPTKGRRTRVLPLLRPLRDSLVSHPTRFAGRWVFCHPDSGDPYAYSSLTTAWNYLLKSAGITEQPRKLRFHDLRHTFATAVLADGKDIAWASEALGHASINITLSTYAHVIRREDRSALVQQRLEEAMGGVAR